MERSNIIARVAAGAAIAVAVVVVVVLLLRGASPYTVKADFISASQLVKGNNVQVSGAPAGTVQDITLTPNGQAQITMKIDSPYAPLKKGTRAIVRQASLSGEANRYVDLQLGSGTGKNIPNGGTISSEQTESSVDLDQLFDLLGPRERAAARKDITGFAETYAGRADMANRAFHYLTPELASSSRLFSEVNRDSGSLRRFIDESSRLFSDVAERNTDVTGLVDHLATVNSALAAQRADVQASIHQLPSFMRKANTTFVNLRATLDDLDPLVASSKPVVRKLRPFFAQLRPFAAEAVPTVRDLSTTIQQPGDANDLIDLLEVQPPLDKIANGPVRVHGKTRRGAFPESIDAFQQGGQELAFARPYAPDLTGWFDDFSRSGQYDALGGFSRAGLALSALTFSPLLPTGGILPVPPILRQKVFLANVDTKRNSRCPGSIERDHGDNSTPYKPYSSFDCDPSQVPIGP